MEPLTVAFILLPSLFALVLCGFHIAFALAGLSTLGIILINGSLSTGLFVLSSTCFEALRSYAFATVQLFVLMGALMTHSGAARDLFKLANAFLKKIPGGLGIATIMANAVFGAVTGVSVASCAVFSQISVPEMIANNYNKRFSTGAVAGSAVLGMLIPPSLLMVVYGMLSEQSIGKMFLAGVLPGIILALMFSIGVVLLAKFKPDEIFLSAEESEAVASEDEEVNMLEMVKGVIPIVSLILVVLGGMWGGVFTPTEASGIGTFGALIIAFLLGMRWEGFKRSLLDTAAGVSSILLLLMTANMYSRMLTLSGFVTWLSSAITSMNSSPYVILTLFLLFILALGMVLDSTSILILTVPIMVPIMSHFGFDLIWIGIVIIVATEVGLITPPFGMNAFAVKSTCPVPISVEEIFRGAFPFVLIMLVFIVILIMCPSLSTWLPGLI